jgi:phosphate transport system permease protein
MFKQRIAFLSLSIFSIGILFAIGSIFALILVNGLSVLNWNFLISITSFDFKGVPHGGIGPAIAGTFMVTGLGLVFAVPVGILAGIYLSEYRSKGKIFNVLRMMVANLAGVPSVVHGLFGLAVFAVLFKFGLSILSSALTLSILALPIIIMTTENAMRDVPNDLREASYSLGAKKWQSALLVVFPVAASKIMTGVILASARIAGETAPILFTGATLYLAHYPTAINQQFMALPYMIYGLMTTSINISASTHFAYGIALVLITLIALMNIAIVIFRSKTRKNS